jgi:hypothetical protein
MPKPEQQASAPEIPPEDESNATQKKAAAALTQYTEVLQRALQEMRKNSYRNKAGELCVGVIPEEVRDILKLGGADGNDLIIHPLMYLGYLEYKRSYWYEFTEQDVEEFILREPEGLGQWDVDRIVDDLFLSLQKPGPDSYILP